MSDEDRLAARGRDDRLDDVLTWVLGTMDRLRAQGLVEGGQFRLTETGRARFAELESQGFEPTGEEVQWAMSALVDVSDDMEDDREPADGDETDDPGDDEDA